MSGDYEAFSNSVRTGGHGVPDRGPLRNPAGLALTLVGLISAVVGAILWGTGAHQLASDQLGADYARAIGLDNGLLMPTDTSATDADTALIWWGVGLLILGVLLLVARLIIAAARPRQLYTPLRPSLSERMAERQQRDGDQ